MRIFVDLDNTLLDFDRGWTDLHQEMRSLYGYDAPPVQARIPQQYNQLHELSGHATPSDFWRWFERNMGWWRIPPMPGAVEAMHHLQSLGGQITFITARPHSAVSATQRTLDNLFGRKLPYGLSFSSRKVDLAWPGDVWFEDHPGTLAALAEVADLHLFRFAWTWNEGAPGDPINHWEQVLEWESF